MAVTWSLQFSPNSRGTQGRGSMTRRKIIIISSSFLLCAMVSLVLFAQTSGKSQTPETNKTIKVDVDLVTVNATVTDTQNRVITGLDKANFRVWERSEERRVGKEC